MVVSNPPSWKKPAAISALLASLLVIAGIAYKIDSDVTTEPESVNTLAVHEKTDVPFASTSPWNTPISSDAQIDPKSSFYVADFRRQFAEHFGTVGINTSKYTPPVYVVDSSAPNVKVDWNNCQKKDNVNAAFLEQVAAVPIPVNATPADGTDAEMVVWQPSTDTMWDLWKVKKTGVGGWSACWGGKLDNASKSDGVFPAPFGTTASGLALLGGLIRPAELRNGEIDHALSLGLFDIKANTFVPPANRTDGQSTNENAIPEGQRFRLNPAVDVDKLNMTRAGKTIARAIQKYGFIVRDHSDSVNFYAENHSTAAASMSPGGYSPLFDDEPSYAVLKNFPWQELQAIAPPPN